MDSNNFYLVYRGDTMQGGNVINLLGIMGLVMFVVFALMLILENPGRYYKELLKWYKNRRKNIKWIIEQWNMIIPESKQ